MVCARETENKGWCSRCELFADVLVGPGMSGRPTEDERADMEEVLAPDRGRTSETRWRSLLAAHAGSEDILWMKRRDPVPEDAPIDESAFPLTEAELENGLQFLRQRLAGRAHPEPHELCRLLQRGIPLPDGSWLSRGDHVWSLDGEVVPGKLPYAHLLRAMTGTKNERRQVQECDLSLLLGVMGALSMPRHRAHMRHRRRQGEHHRRRQGEHLRDIQLFLRVHRDTHGPLEGATLFFSWLEWIEGMLRSRLAAGEQPRNWMQGMIWARFRDRGRHRYEMPPEVPWADLAVLGMPWVERWDQETSGGTEWHSAEAWPGPALVVNQGRLFLRMLRGGRWKRVPLPPWPELWALLLSWQLSPPEHPAHRRLRTLQWIWDDPDGELIPAEQDCRALGLLHSVCEENDRCEYQEEGAPGIIVEGTSGLFYHVRCGHGVHGARFSVSGCTSAEQARQGGGTPICIREHPGIQRLPAGDVIASVVLALMDDQRSQQNLHPLAEFIRTNLHGASRLESERERRGRRVRGDMQGAVRGELRRFFHMHNFGGWQRWTRTFPGLYEILIRMPLDSVMLLPREQRGQMSFEGNRFSMMIRDEEERELVEGLARTTGWRPRGERDERIRWVRVDVPFERVRHWLVELLGPFQRRHGLRGAPPWWNLYRDPFPPGNLPQRIPDWLNQPFDDGPEDLFDAA